MINRADSEENIEKKGVESTAYLESMLVQAHRIQLADQGYNDKGPLFKQGFKANLEAAIRNGLTRQELCRFLAARNSTDGFEVWPTSYFVEIWNSISPKKITLQYFNVVGTGKFGGPGEDGDESVVKIADRVANGVKDLDEPRLGASQI